MLKLIYGDAGLSLEQLAEPLEAWIATRSVLALRTGQGVWVAPGRASIALPDWEPWRSQLVSALARPRQAAAPASISSGITDAVTIEPVDEGWVEVSYTGIWVASSPTAETGIMVVAWSDRAEGLLAQWWQAAQVPAPRSAQKCLPLE